MHRHAGIGVGAALLLLAGPPARADVAVSSNDRHTILDNGVQVAARPPMPDTLSVIDLAGEQPRVTATIEVPGSVVGPPFSVWVAEDESWCIVTSNTKADPTGPGGISPDNRVSVVELGQTPRIVQSLTAGLGATTVRVSPDGRVALIANRTEGTVSVFSVVRRRLTPAGTVEFGNPKAGPSGIAFAHDGQSALVSRDGDNMVSVLHLDGTKVTVETRPLTTAIRPYALDVNAEGTLAAVGNLGRGDGDVDSVSLIDLTTTPFRAVETVGVPSGPEGVKFSPDGRYLAVGSQLGTQKPAGSPFRTEHGVLTLFEVRAASEAGAGGAGSGRLRRVATAPIGGWNQGFAFSRDGRTILLQDMVERQIQVFRWDGTTLTEAPPLPIDGGPAAIRTGWP